MLGPARQPLPHHSGVVLAQTSSKKLQMSSLAISAF